MGAAASHQEFVVIDGRRVGALQTLYTTAHRVEVVATSFGPGVPGVRAYHTSVIVDDVEYSFSGNGITAAPPLSSHMCYANQPQVTYMGLTAISGPDMLKALGPYFCRGSYDLLRKNCNSFSDCALYCLLDARLDPSYRSLEQIGHMADKQVGLVQIFTDGCYRPNPQAHDFEVEKVVRKISKTKLQLGLR